tara:strand:- start:622 stop:1161 length:540 start_codon:yes stop_codon:yes gene_type:complete
LVSITGTALLVLIITILLNSTLGISAMGDRASNPLYSPPCFWDESTAPPDDPADKGGGESSQDVLDEIVMPTNSTSTDTGFGDSNPFNAITEGIEATAKTLETIKNYIGGGYIMGVIGNVTLCNQVMGDDPATTGVVEQWYYVRDSSNPVWNNLLEGVEFLIIFANIIVIVSYVRGVIV